MPRAWNDSENAICRAAIAGGLDVASTRDELANWGWNRTIEGVTSASWTQADLAAGTFRFGLASDGTHGSGADITEGGSSASLDIASVYLELTTTPLDTAEPVRNVISTLLRLFRKPLRKFSINVPAQFGDVSPGDYVWTSHSLLPVTSDGDMWVEPWKHVPLYILQVRDELDPPSVTLECLDLRQVWVYWWSPLRTTIGVTDDYRGIAKLDRGGGWKTFRDQAPWSAVTIVMVCDHRRVIRDRRRHGPSSPCPWSAVIIVMVRDHRPVLRDHRPVLRDHQLRGPPLPGDGSPIMGG